MRATRLSLVPLALILLAAVTTTPAGAWQQSPARGQRPAPPEQQGSRDFAAFHATIEVVRVPVVVVDVEGEFIDGLTAPDFKIVDGGTSQPVEHFVSDQAPSTVGVLVDSSAAMAPHEDRARRAVIALSQGLRPEDELFLIGFATDAVLLARPAMSRDEYLAAAGRWRPSPSAERALYDAAYLGLAAMDEAAYEKRALIVISAGDDNASRTNPATVEHLARTVGVTIHAISLRDPRERAKAGAIGGRPFGPVALVRSTAGLAAQRPGIEDRYGGVEAWLERAHQDICRYLNNQYLLHYTPKRPPRPGVWRAIRVDVSVPFDEVRARSGYVR